MEIRDNVARVPTRPFVLLIAFLTMLALALSGWYALARNSAAPAQGPDRAYATPVTLYGPVGPDAQERDLNQRIAKIKEDASHGH